MTIDSFRSFVRVTRPTRRDPAVWCKTAGLFAAIIALALPRSTSLVAIFAAVRILVLPQSLSTKRFIQSLERPVCAPPIQQLPESCGRKSHGHGGLGSELRLSSKKYCQFCFQFSLSDFIEDWMCVIGVEAAGGMAIKIRSSNVFPDVQDKNRRLAQRLSLFQALELNL